MISKNIVNYLELGHNFDNLFPLIMQKEWIKLEEKLLNLKKVKNSVNILIKGIFINIKKIDDKYFVNPNYVKLINENIGKIIDYNDNLIIYDLNEQLVENINGNLYIIDKLLQKDSYVYINSQKVLTQTGWGLDLKWFTNNLILILKDEEIICDQKLFDENYNLNNFAIQSLNLEGGNSWIYFGEFSYQNQPLDLEIDKLIAENNISSNIEEVEILSEEKANELNLEEIHF